jgi:hypothetical protein
MNLFNFIKYSGVWIGLVLNPFHWRFKYDNTNPTDAWTEHVFENCLYFGPIWIRVIIDDGRW